MFLCVYRNVCRRRSVCAGLGVPISLTKQTYICKGTTCCGARIALLCYTCIDTVCCPCGCCYSESATAIQLAWKSRELKRRSRRRWRAAIKIQAAFRGLQSRLYVCRQVSVPCYMLADRMIVIDCSVFITMFAARRRPNDASMLERHGAFAVWLCCCWGSIST